MPRPPLQALRPIRTARLWATLALCLWTIAVRAQDTVFLEQPTDYEMSSYREPAPPPPQRRDLDRARWEELTKDVSYDEKPLDENSASRGRGSTTTPSGGGSGGQAPPTPSPPLEFSVPTWVRNLLFALLLGLLVLLAYFVIRARGRKNKRLDPASVEARLDEIEESEAPIGEGEFDQLLREALARGQYRLALRVHFLVIMGKLAENGSIVRQKGKTNRTYLHEMAGSPDREPFGGIVRTYERAWFGQRELDEQSYRSAAPAFEDFYRKLSDNRP